MGRKESNQTNKINLLCLKAGNSELETMTRNSFKNIRYYASLGYLQVLKRSG